MGSTIIQSSLFSEVGSFVPEEQYAPIIGIVLSLYYSNDTSGNKSAVSSPIRRGSQIQADVQVVDDGTDTPQIISNVVVLPTGSSGFFDYTEDLPTPCSGRIDNESYDPSFPKVDYNMLDGDWCVVQYVGGRTKKPIMTHWFPHPSNIQDPATDGGQQYAGDTEGKEYLSQQYRLFKRKNGTSFCVTSEGSLYINTQLANADKRVEGGKIVYDESDIGGDVVVDVKPESLFEINFNKTVDNPDEPDLPQQNPPVEPIAERSTENTVFRLDKDSVNAIAKEMIRLLFSGDSQTILLGGKEDSQESEYQKAVLGTNFAEQKYNPLIAALTSFAEAFSTHTHEETGAATKPPLLPFTFAEPTINTESDSVLSERVKIIENVGN